MPNYIHSIVPYTDWHHSNLREYLGGFSLCISASLLAHVDLKKTPSYATYTWIALRVIDYIIDNLSIYYTNARKRYLRNQRCEIQRCKQ